MGKLWGREVSVRGETVGEGIAQRKLLTSLHCVKHLLAHY